MFRQSGYRFADMNMRQRENCSHFRMEAQMETLLLDRKWLQ